MFVNINFNFLIIKWYDIVAGTHICLSNTKDRVRGRSKDWRTNNALVSRFNITGLKVKEHPRSNNIDALNEIKDEQQSTIADCIYLLSQGRTTPALHAWNKIRLLEKHSSNSLEERLRWIAARDGIQLDMNRNVYSQIGLVGTAAMHDLHVIQGPNYVQWRWQKSILFIPYIRGGRLNYWEKSSQGQTIKLPRMRLYKCWD